MGKAPFDRLVLLALADQLKPGAVTVDEPQPALAALAGENDDLEIGGQALQQLRRVFLALRLGVAGEIYGQALEWDFAFESRTWFENQSRLVWVHLVDFRDKDELLGCQHFLERDEILNDGARRIGKDQAREQSRDYRPIPSGHTLSPRILPRWIMNPS